MTRIPLAPLLCAALAACQPTSENVARDGAIDAAICDIAVPPITAWNGKSLPPFESERPAIYLGQNPADPKHVFAMLVDEIKITAVLSVPVDALGSFLALAIGPCPPPAAAVAGVPAAATTDLRCKPAAFVVKVPPGPRPGSGGQDPILAANLTPAIFDAFQQIADALASGQLCPGK